MRHMLQRLVDKEVTSVEAETKNYVKIIFNDGSVIHLEFHETNTAEGLFGVDGGFVALSDA